MQQIATKQITPTTTKRPTSIWGRLKAEIAFMKQLMALNLSSAMEYRASFISQIVGMMVNNGIMLFFWLIFFDRFGTIRGYNFEEIFLLFGIVAFAFGISYMIAGNTGYHMAYLIAQGRLDYYLVFPRNLLLHIIFSRMQISAIGDLVFGLFATVFVIGFDLAALGRLMIVSVLAAAIFTAYGIFAGSLSFFIGNAQNASQQMIGAMITFALYPYSIFNGLSRVLLLTVIPAAFVGAIPAELVRTPSPQLWGWLVLAVVVSWVIATAVFYWGLRRYESGSAINVNV